MVRQEKILSPARCGLPPKTNKQTGRLMSTGTKALGAALGELDVIQWLEGLWPPNFPCLGSPGSLWAWRLNQNRPKAKSHTKELCGEWMLQLWRCCFWLNGCW